MRILFLADIVGRPGREAVTKLFPELRAEISPDIVIANGENAAGGAGIDPGTAEEIFKAGVDVITTGNHIWHKKEVFPYLDANKHRIVRPLNFAPGVPGVGFTRHQLASGEHVAVVNLIARVFMPDYVNCPFQAIEHVLANDLRDEKFIFVDFHGEATSEKVAMGYFLDGRVSVLVGTHTHVQTADERVFPKGTAYISDVGMCGPIESIIGVQIENVIQRFTTGIPVRFEVAKGPAMVNGVVVNLNSETGLAESIERLQRAAEQTHPPGAESTTTPTNGGLRRLPGALPPVAKKSIQIHTVSPLSHRC